MSRAYTLIELVAVLVVLAIVAAVAAPAALQGASVRPEAAQQQIVRDLTYARARAMTSGHATWVTFDTAGESYAVRIDDPGNPGFAGSVPLTDPATGLAMSVLIGRNSFAGVDLVGASFDGAATVGFDGLGRPMKTDGTILAAHGTVTVSGPRTITVRTPTGHISGD